MCLYIGQATKSAEILNTNANTISACELESLYAKDYRC